MREPQVVRTPWVQKMSLWAIGTPVSAPPVPAASARSAAAASLSACSRVTEMNALSVAWLASIRARNARTSSTLENFRARRSAASCASVPVCQPLTPASLDRKSTRLNSSHSQISYAVFCLKKKKHELHNGLVARTHERHGEHHNLDLPDHEREHGVEGEMRPDRHLDSLNRVTCANNPSDTH